MGTGRAPRDLAGESSRAVEKLLDRQDRRSRGQRKLSSSRNGSSAKTARQVCGARAADAREAEAEFGVPVEDKDDDWEDVSDADADADVPGRPENERLVVSLSKQDLDGVDLSSDSKKKRRGPAFTKHDRSVCLDIHRTHLMFLLSRGMALSVAADDPVLQAVALSLVPAGSDVCDRDALVRLVGAGFGGGVRAVPGDREGADGNVLGRLGNADDLKAKELNVEQLVVLSAALLRGAGVPTRIMWALDPAPLRPEDVVKKAREEEKKKNKEKEDESKRKAPRGKRKRKDEAPAAAAEENTSGVAPAAKKRVCDVELEQATAMAIEASSWAAERKNDNRRNQDEDQKEGKAEDRCESLTVTDHRYWLEVYAVDKGSWEPLHIVPPPSLLVEPYVVAFNGTGAKDLTKKYCAQENLARIAPLRDEAWWARTLSSHRRAETAALREALVRHRNAADSEADNKNENNPGDAAPAEDLARRASEHEDRGMAAKGDAARRAVPTTLKGFQKHEQFVLTRHIKTHEVLKPGSQAVGVLKGEAYYNRSDICVVHTADKWKRQGRVVRESELNRPAKMIKKRGVQQRSGGELEQLADQQPMSSFYGPWQTDEWQMPSAKDGIVPKNEWGSVEIPPLAHALPGGTVHVDLPDAAKVCRQLGIDFADAVAGFEYKKRRMVPTKCGVIVCAESEDVLREAWIEYTRHAAIVAKEKRLLEGELAWRDLLAALVTHIRVHRSFADDEGALLLHASMKNDIKGGAAKGVITKPSSETELQLPVNVDFEEI